MKPILVAYATREGQTRKIAEHVSAALRARGDGVHLVDASALPADFDPTRYSGAVLAASLHRGTHEREMVELAGKYRAELELIPTAFLSVSLTEAGVEDRTAPLDRRAKAAVDVKTAVDGFCAETGLHPSRVWPLAGALLYTRYGLVERWVMRMIASRSGGSTDTSRDHEYTDWRGLDRFVTSMAAEIESCALHAASA